MTSWVNPHLLHGILATFVINVLCFANKESGEIIHVELVERARCELEKLLYPLDQ